jgi:hypothetical protein
LIDDPDTAQARGIPGSLAGAARIGHSAGFVSKIVYTGAALVAENTRTDVQVDS